MISKPQLAMAIAPLSEIVSVMSCSAMCHTDHDSLNSAGRGLLIDRANDEADDAPGPPACEG